MMIDGYEFGRMSVNGVIYGRDLKIINGRVVPDWWRNDGHRVEADDIADILAANPDIVIIGTGSPGRMVTAPSLIRLFAEKGIQLIQHPTPRAIKEFNRIIDTGDIIAAGFHLTC